jgi:outer membrane cobalamin receptor
MISGRVLLFAGACGAVLVFGTRRANAFPPVPDDSQSGADIEGVIADSATGERVPGANVVLKGTSRGAATNNNGFYLISSVPPGTYELVVGAVGYQRRNVPVTVRGTGALTVNIKIAVRLIETREVVVETQSMSSLTERSASVHFITPKELQRLPAAGQQDLLRSLQVLPGITSTSDVSAKFFVRGGAGDQNLILLDGMKVYNPFHAFGLFSIFDPDIIRNAEVYTGAFPAGYGGRLSSVVNVTTKDGNLTRLSGNANVNFLSGKLELDGPLGDDNSWMVSGRSSLLTNTIDKLIPNAAPMSFTDLFFKGTIGTPTGRFGLRGFTSADDVKPIGLDQPNYQWRSAAFSAVLSSLVADRLYFDATTSYSRSTIAQIPKAPGLVNPASSKLEEVNLRAEMTSFLEDQNTLFEGFEFNFPSVTDSLYVRNVYPRLYQQSALEWYAWVRYAGVAEAFRYDLGLHGDIGLMFGGGSLLQCLQPRFTLSYDFGASWIAKASFGVFTQNLITISNEDDLISLFDAWVILPDNLRPEEARHYVLGIEGNLLPSLATSLQVYIKDYRSLTLYNSNKVFPDDPDYLSGTGVARGLEFLLRYGSPLVDLYGSYALASVDVSADGVTYAPRYDRRHTIKAIGTIHILEGLDATLRWEYGSGYPFTQGAGSYSRLTLGDIGTDPNPEGLGGVAGALGAKNAARLPAYHRMDAGVSYRMTVGIFRGTVGASVMNLYDARNILYYDRNTGKTAYMIPFLPTASFTLEF